MLYPDFKDLLALKDLKSGLIHPSYRSSSSIILGGQHSPFRGHGLEFDSVRQYVPGDDIRNIDWRVTARTGSPHLKIFKEERERQIVLCVDMNAAMRFGTRNTFKSVQAAKIGALLGWRAIANHDRVSACLFGDVPEGMEFFASKRTSKSFLAMLKRFSEPSNERHQVGLEEAFKHVSQAVHTGSLVYFISDFMDIHKDFQQEVSLNHLNKKCDVIFISINDRSDKILVPVGTLSFLSTMQERMRVNTDSLSGREAYANQWKENRKKLYEMTSQLRIPVLEVTTESDIRKDLPLGLKMLAARRKR